MSRLLLLGSLVFASSGLARAEDLVQRVCVETDGTIVVENDCGCNDALLCTAELKGTTVKVVVTKDPTRAPMCDDCFAMVPGRCALPAAAKGRVEVQAGSVRLALDLAKGKPAKRVCQARQQH